MRPFSPTIQSILHADFKTGFLSFQVAPLHSIRAFKRNGIRGWLNHLYPTKGTKRHNQYPFLNGLHWKKQSHLCRTSRTYGL